MSILEFLDRKHMVIWIFISSKIETYWMTSSILLIDYSLQYNNITIQCVVYHYNSVIE